MNKDELQEQVNVRLSTQELAILDRLAKGSGRTRSNIVRYLILWANNNQEDAQKLLGNLPEIMEATK